MWAGHSPFVFRIPFKPIVPGDPDFAPNRIKERMKYPGSLVKLIRELELIIIDEISMVRADIIGFVDLLLRTYSGNQREPFGGKQLLLWATCFSSNRLNYWRYARYTAQVLPRCVFLLGPCVLDRINLVPIELRKIYRQSQGEFVELLDPDTYGRCYGRRYLAAELALRGAVSACGGEGRDPP